MELTAGLGKKKGNYTAASALLDDTTAGQFLDAQRVRQQRLTEPAVLLRDHQAEQAHVFHLIDDGLRVGVRVLELLGRGNDLPVDELPHGGDDFALHLGEAGGLGETSHDATLSKTAASPWPPPMHMVSRP